MTTSPITLYGIPNCDSVKKARVWLAEHGIVYQFHDFKKQGVPAVELQRWIEATGWDVMLNRKGTTWRKLDAAVQASVSDGASAAAVMQEHASTIKRPVIDWGHGHITVGYAPQNWPQQG